MSAKHTPGPWGVVHRTMIGRPTTIAEAFVVSPKAGPALAYLPAGRAAAVDVQEANARLVTAAPDMLRDGRALVAWLREFIGADAWKEVVEEFPAPAVVTFIATLDRAEGGR